MNITCERYLHWIRLSGVNAQADDGAWAEDIDALHAEADQLRHHSEACPHCSKLSKTLEQGLEGFRQQVSATPPPRAVRAFVDAAEERFEPQLRPSRAVRRDTLDRARS